MCRKSWSSTWIAWRGACSGTSRTDPTYPPEFGPFGRSGTSKTFWICDSIFRPTVIKFIFQKEFLHSIQRVYYFDHAIYTTMPHESWQIVAQISDCCGQSFYTRWLFWEGADCSFECCGEIDLKIFELANDRDCYRFQSYLSAIKSLNPNRPPPTVTRKRKQPQTYPRLKNTS